MVTCVLNVLIGEIAMSSKTGLICCICLLHFLSAGCTRPTIPEPSDYTAQADTHQTNALTAVPPRHPSVLSVDEMLAKKDAASVENTQTNSYSDTAGSKLPTVVITMDDLQPLEEETVREMDRKLVRLNNELKALAADNANTAMYARSYLALVEEYDYASHLMLWDEMPHAIDEQVIAPYPTQESWKALQEEIEKAAEKAEEARRQEKYQQALAEVQWHAREQTRIAGIQAAETANQTNILREQAQIQREIMWQNQQILNHQNQQQYQIQNSQPRRGWLWRTW